MPDSDGYPEAWFTNGFKRTGPFFETQVYHYPNDQQATTLWYHDHALGTTRLNVYRRARTGFYLHPRRRRGRRSTFPAGSTRSR